MQEKFKEVTDKLMSIKSNLAEAISVKGVETAPNALFQTMIENIGNISIGENKTEIEEWAKPHDWIDIEQEPLEDGEIRLLMCDLFGKEGNSIWMARRSGASSIKASIDWGDGTVEEIDHKGSDITITHTFQGVGIPCDRGYDQYLVKVKFYEFKSSPNQIKLYKKSDPSGGANNLLWFYGDVECLTNLEYFVSNGNYLLEKIKIVNSSNVLYGAYAFSSCYSLHTIEADLSSLMNGAYMLSNCYTLKNANLVNTGKATSMAYMFSNCYLLQYANGIDTTSCKNTSYMFNNCNSLRELGVIDLRECTNPAGMFSGCRKLKQLDIINTTNTIYTNAMFSGCISLTKLSEIDATNATTMNGMFNGCMSLQEISIINMNNVTSLANMFNTCVSLRKTPPLNTTGVPSSAFANMFLSCFNLTEIGTITLSNDIKLDIGASGYKPPVINIDFSYDIDNPPVFTQTTPIKINYTQLSAESLNKLMEQLPDGNGKTLDLKYNRGSLDCDPSIATDKNWTVLVN